MEIVFLPLADEHLKHWVSNNNKAILKRITMLISSIKESPTNGIGKPELLKFQLSGKWSRRIDKENRLIYSFNENQIFIYSLKGHYFK